MASGNEKFTIDANDVESMVHDAPSNYDETDSKPSAALPDQTKQYPAPHNPSEYPQQQHGFGVYEKLVTQAPVQQNIEPVTNQTMPNDYFSLALFVTLCCCLPFGIVALVKSSEVRSRSAVRDFDGATISSNKAKSWSSAGLLFGGVALGIYVIISIQKFL